MITPDEINSLFSNQKTNNNGQQSQPRDTDSGFSMFRFDSKDMEEEVEKDEVVETSAALSMPSLSDLKMPDWIRNAGPREGKRKDKAVRGRRKEKALTEDWRFWAATLLGIGFTTAFINIYQQTGGIFEKQELVI